MSEDATLDKFVEQGEEEENQPENEPYLPEVDEVPSDWNLVTVEDVSEDLIGGGTPSKNNEEHWGGTIPWASVKDLDGIELAETEDYITESGIENSAANIAPKDSIIISTRMTVGEPFINRVDMAINQDMKAIIPDTKQVNPLFLVYSLWDKDSYLKSLGRGTTVDGITTRDLSLTHLELPELKEQRKIATVLYTVDQAIQKTEEIIDQYERFKKGLSQDLLQKGTRNHDFLNTDSRYGQIPENWSLERLVDVTEIVGRTEPPTDVDKYWDGGIPWATPDDIRTLDSPTISKTEQTVTQAALEEVSSNLVPPGSVLLTTRATVGLCAVNEVEMTTSRAFKDLIPGDRLDTWYLYYRISAMENYLNRLGWGSTFTEVIKPVLENVTIPVPELEEQKEIGEKLLSIDRVITENIQIKNQYQRLKQGLMQDLLSGEIQTTDTNIEVPDKIAQHG